jgi:hypothetical protein
MTPSTAEPAISSLYPLEDFYARRPGAAPIVQTDSASLDLLAKSYARAGRTALIWTAIEAAAVPEPYRSLLVHGTDMTSTLENFHKEKLHVELLGRHVNGQEYFREVVLRLDQSDRRVEFGAIKILLDLFPNEARQEILRERQALGRILIESGLEFSSQPRAFLHLAADDFINRTLGLRGLQFLYGRRNTLVDAWERPLAEIVEILPPC